MNARLRYNLAVLAPISILSLLSGLVPAYSTADGLNHTVWLIGSLAVAVAAMTLLNLEVPAASEASSRWSRWAAACFFAAVNPLATESVQHPTLASTAVALTACAALLAMRDRGRTTNLAIAVLLMAACFLEPAAIVFPLSVAGYVWGRYRPGLSMIWVAFGISGIVFGRSLGLPWLTAHSYHGPGAMLHRDMALFLPVILLGLGGYFRLQRAAETGEWKQTFLLRWAELSVAGLLLITFGLPLNVRLFVLPFWWLLPAGIDELIQGLRSPSRRTFPFRGVLATVGLIGAILTLPVLRRLPDGLLLAIHLLDGS